MEYTKIKRLLEKFFDGETTAEEENLLKNFFDRPDISKEYEQEKKIFDAFGKLSHESDAGTDLQNEIEFIVQKAAKDENRSKILKIIRWSGSVAAVFLVALSLYFYLKPVGMKDTYTSADEAYEAAREILFKVSHTMNRESGAITKLAYINKGLSAINTLEKISEPINNLKVTKDENN
jgi:hypothetical protein